MKKNLENKRLNNVIDIAMKDLNELIDVNTVVGTPIKTETNDIIIPVSKVTFGILCGGGEYGKVSIFKSGTDLPYSAGNGALVSIKPCGFLIKSGKNDFKIINLANSPYEKIFEKTADFINENLKIKNKKDE